MTDPKLGAIAVVLQAGKVLLVQRQKEPNAGTWGFPGGHVELGETALDAAARELREETAVIARPIGYLTNIDVIKKGQSGEVEYHYLLAAVQCNYVSGTPIAADDALDAGWFAPAEIADLHQSPRVQDVLDLLDF